MFQEKVSDKKQRWRRYVWTTEDVPVVEEFARALVFPALRALVEKQIQVKGYSRFRKGKHEMVHAYAKNIVDVTSLERVSGKVFTGDRVPTRKSYTKQLTGKIGEAIALAFKGGMYLQDYLKLKENNLPFDLINPRKHVLYEVKAGLVSNHGSGRKWRLTKGGIGKKEREWLKEASPAVKRLYNMNKEQKILARKLSLKQHIESKTGDKYRVKTITFILNPDTQKADMFEFKGLHQVIRWHWDMANKGYKRTLKYGFKT